MTLVPLLSFLHVTGSQKELERSDVFEKGDLLLGIPPKPAVPKWLDSLCLLPAQLHMTIDHDVKLTWEMIYDFYID